MIFIQGIELYHEARLRGFVFEGEVCFAVAFR